MKWIPDETKLMGSDVDLLPLHEGIFDELCVPAADPRIWEFIPAAMGTRALQQEAFTEALALKQQGVQFPFVIIHKASGRIVGSTRLMNIEQAHKKLEIGWTWLHPDYWAGVVNLECKLLLLAYCFETLGAYRVQLKTDENNMRSRKAIEKIGGRYEGILRNDMIRANGTRRNTAYFSVIDEEWPDAKRHLTNLLVNKRNEQAGA